MHVRSSKGAYSFRHIILGSKHCVWVVDDNLFEEAHGMGFQPFRGGRSMVFRRKDVVPSFIYLFCTVKHV